MHDVRQDRPVIQDGLVRQDVRQRSACKTARRPAGFDQLVRQHVRALVPVSTHVGSSCSQYACSSSPLYVLSSYPQYAPARFLVVASTMSSSRQYGRALVVPSTRARAGAST